MDFVIGFIFGYFLKDIGLHLKRIINYKYDWDTEFEEWSSDDLP
nr:hypothetical protein [uncultured Mediterranean phage uvMED]